MSHLQMDLQSSVMLNEAHRVICLLRSLTPEYYREMFENETQSQSNQIMTVTVLLYYKIFIWLYKI